MAPPHFPYVVNARIWEPIEPIDRGERYEDPLEATLAAQRLGTVAGAGSQLTAQVRSSSSTSRSTWRTTERR